MATGIDAPISVPEGTQAPIEVSAPGRDELTVTVIGTGQVFTIKLDGEGNGRFELPSTAVAGEEIVVHDPQAPSVATVISVIPATGL